MSSRPCRTTSHLLCMALSVGVLVACGGGVPEANLQAPWPTDGWAESTPEAQGLASAPFADLDARIRAGDLGYVDGFVVIKDGYLVSSATYNNDYAEISRGYRDIMGCGVDSCTDESELHEFNYYHPDWHPYYQGRDVHSLQSVTKSVTATVVGVAITRGDIEGVELPLLSFFEDYDLSGVEARLHDATLEDLLTMRSGIEWHEQDRPLDETNTTLQLELSEDWIQFTLDQPMDANPGEKFVYNSGGSHLMSGVVRTATGRYVDDYAQEYLFGPLGIPDFHWKKTPKGYPDTEGGLFLATEQLAKIGYLHLRGGEWDGHRILSESWVEAATARQVGDINEEGWSYGYQWWRPDTDGVDVWSARGFGGQYLLVLPEHDLIGVVNSWNIFGQRVQPVATAFLNALIASTRVGEDP